MKRRSFNDYDTEGLRNIALRVYANKGEVEIIDEAIRATERIKDRSAWMNKIAVREACRLLGITDYPY
jgi:hypothetical protein